MGTQQGWDLLLVSAAALILVSVARLHSFIPPLAVLRPGMLATLVALFALVTGHKGARRIEHLATPLGRLMLIFIAWALVTAPFAIFPGRSVSYLFNGFLREAIVALVVSASIRNVEDLRRLLKVYAYGVIAFSVLAAGTGARNIGGGGYDANDSAMFVVSGIPLIFYFLVRARTALVKVAFAGGLAIAASAVALSGSRGGFLAFVAVMGFSLFFLKGVKTSMRVVVVVVAGAILAANVDSDFWNRLEGIGSQSDYNVTDYTGRVQVWRRGVGYMLEHPITGVGIADFGTAEGWNPIARARAARGYGVKWSAAHSIWIEVGAELGIPGLLAFIGIFVLSVRVLWSADQRSLLRSRGGSVPERQQLGELGRPLIGVLIGVAVAGTFLSRAYSSLTWLPFALALTVDKLGNLMGGGAGGRAPRASTLGSRKGVAPRGFPRGRPASHAQLRSGRGV